MRTAYKEYGFDSADATHTFQGKGTDEDPLLEIRDRVIVFGRQPDRGPALAQVLQELKLQARDLISEIAEGGSWILVDRGLAMNPVM